MGGVSADAGTADQILRRAVQSQLYTGHGREGSGWIEDGFD